MLGARLANGMKEVQACHKLTRTGRTWSVGQDGKYSRVMEILRTTWPHFIWADTCRLKKQADSTKPTIGTRMEWDWAAHKDRCALLGGVLA